MKSHAARDFFGNRRMIVLSESPLDGIRFASWNCLADSLSDAFPHCDKSVLTWAHRKELIVNHVASMVEKGFLVALQEGLFACGGCLVCVLFFFGCE